MPYKRSNDNTLDEISERKDLGSGDTERVGKHDTDELQLNQPNVLYYIQLKSEVYIHLSQIHLNSVFPQFLTFNHSKNFLF
jgi:hypothetical protein